MKYHDEVNTELLQYYLYEYIYAEYDGLSIVEEPRLNGI